MQKDRKNTPKKPRYTHHSKPYRKIGDIPKETLEEVKSLFRGLCEGIPGIGSFGTSGVHTLSDGAIGCDLRLHVLRMEHNKEAQKRVREIAERYDIPWLTRELLENEPENNHFIISPDGELHATIW